MPTVALIILILAVLMALTGFIFPLWREFDPHGPPFFENYYLNRTRMNS
jgi:hypothetical protein